MNSQIIAENTSLFHFETALHMDITYHLLAHMDIGKHPANLFSISYIEDINKEKLKLSIDPQNFIKELERLSGTYKEHFDKLYILSFSPARFKDYDEFNDKLLCYLNDSNTNEPFFSTSETKAFLRKFIELMHYEKETFYEAYWTRKQLELLPMKKEFANYCIEHGTKILLPVIHHENKKPFIYLCLSMTRYGRGFYSNGFLKSAVRFPVKPDDFLYSFFFAVHEMTHQFIDEITLQSLEHDPDDAFKFGLDIHSMKEHAVIYADYLICKKYQPQYIQDYFRWVFSLYGQAATIPTLPTAQLEDLFMETIKLPKKTLEQIFEYFNTLE